MNILERLDAALIVTRRRGDQRDALCPAHPDTSASLSYGLGDNGKSIVMFCHAGCETSNILAAIGMTLKDLAGEPFIQETYPYTDANGTVLWTVERWANPKDFRIRPGLPPASERVLYGMTWLAWAATHNATVYVVEGEKDANLLHERGIPAVTNVGGAGRGKWLPQYNKALRGLNVVIIADNDDPGRRHARLVADQLADLAASVRLLVAKSGNDLSDHLDAGYSIEQLQPLPELDTGALLIRPADIQIVPVEWVWPGHIPRGALSIIDGDPGDGKSVMTIDLAARWSTGAPLPDGAPNPGPMDVVLVSAEDDPMVIATRLRAAGADLDRIRMLAGIRTAEGDERPFDLSTDLALLEDVLRTTKAGVVVLDPLMAFMGQDVDTYKDHHVRRQLHPYIELAREYGTALLVVRHLTKGGSKAIYKGGGSIAFVGAARSAFLVAREAENQEVRVLANIKLNLAPTPKALRYRIRVSTAYDAPVVEWLGTTDSSAQDLLDHDPREASVMVEAMFFLRDYLTEAGPSSWLDILKSGRAAGMGGSEATLRRAREELGLVHRRTGFGDSSRVTWGLPTDWKPDVQPDQPGLSDSPETTDGNGEIPASSSPVSGALSCSSDSHITQPGISDTDVTSDECDVCSTTQGVGHYQADPAMGVEDCSRCPAHNPYTYGPGGGQS